MKNRRNYYRILHVQPDAPREIIKSSYRTLMQKLKAHPDLGGDEWNAALINEAYSVVMNPHRRAEYDTALRKNQGPTVTPNENARASTAGTAPGHCFFCKTPHRACHPDADQERCTACRSPLALAEHSILEHSTRRAISRLPVRSKLSFYSRWPQSQAHTGVLLDLSLNGLGIQTGTQLAGGDLIKVECHLLSAVARVASIRAVKHTGHCCYHMGAEFISLGFENKQGVFLSTLA